MHNWQMSDTLFLFILILHFVSHVHIPIAQLLLVAFAYLFAFWGYMCIFLFALFFEAVLRFT